jgi:hypothetical protein
VPARIVEIKLYEREKMVAVFVQYLDIIRPMEIAAAIVPMVAADAEQGHIRG